VQAVLFACEGVADDQTQKILGALASGEDGVGKRLV